MVLFFLGGRKDSGCDSGWIVKQSRLFRKELTLSVCAGKELMGSPELVHLHTNMRRKPENQPSPLVMSLGRDSDVTLYSLLASLCVCVCVCVRALLSNQMSRTRAQEAKIYV